MDIVSLRHSAAAVIRNESAMVWVEQGHVPRPSLGLSWPRSRPSRTRSSLAGYPEVLGNSQRPTASALISGFTTPPSPQCRSMPPSLSNGRPWGLAAGVVQWRMRSHSVFQNGHWMICLCLERCEPVSIRVSSDSQMCFCHGPGDVGGSKQAFRRDASRF